MGEISEKTRVTLNIVGAVVLIGAIFATGRFWGDWTATNRHRDETLARHETEISELRRSITEMQGTLRDIRGGQTSSQESLNTAVRNSTYLVTEVKNIQIALAERGIRVTRGD